MPAQLGGSIQLEYAPQGAQQSGALVMLEYQAAAQGARLTAATRAGWMRGVESGRLLRVPMAKTHDSPHRAEGSWVAGAELALRDGLPWGISAATDRYANTSWRRFGRRAQPLRSSPWRLARPEDHFAASSWGSYGAWLQPDGRGPWDASAASDRRAGAAWGGPLQPVHLLGRAPFVRGFPADPERRVPWERFTQQLGPGWGVVIPVNPTPDEPLVAVQIARYYMTINSVQLLVMPGGIELKAYGFEMSLDADSWTWTWSATVRADALQHVAPVDGEPAEVEALVNGVAYRLCVEQRGRSRDFPQTRVKVGGRGKAAVLADRHAPVMSFSNDVALTAQQLANSVLTINGSPIGWAVDWQLDDWLVPAGAWVFQGTYIQAIADIAAAAGGYVQPHRTDATLRILHRYPIKPWEWAAAAPDIELPASVVQVEDTEWVERPAYNRVYVGGIGQGVFGPVTRAGTAGDLIAPPVTHALITAAEAHRQRGRAELGDTGSQEHLQLSLPVLPETGVIVPGTLLRYGGDSGPVTGLVRRIGLRWSSPVMRQTLGVETHVA